MENFNRCIQKANTRTKSSGKIDTGNTTGTGMGRQGHSDFYKNTTRIPRLEWKC